MRFTAVVFVLVASLAVTSREEITPFVKIFET